jgi:hypothetical protein
MYIYGIRFMMTTLRAIHFSTAEMIKNEKIGKSYEVNKQIINTDHGRADRQFESVRKYIKPMGIILTQPDDKHVPEIKCYIRKVKEWVCEFLNTLLFENYPHRLIVEAVYNAIFWVNWFPHKDEIHGQL